MSKGPTILARLRGHMYHQFRATHRLGLQVYHNQESGIQGLPTRKVDQLQRYPV